MVTALRDPSWDVPFAQGADRIVHEVKGVHMVIEDQEALIIGAGPAGLMAAETLGKAGHHVVIAEAMPSPARKFLMAGKSGLNLTKAEPIEAFLNAYGEDSPLRPMLEALPPDSVQSWARDLGQELFTGSTGRVFPTAMKASPILRAWLARVGADLRRRWRWTGWDGEACTFDTPDGPKSLRARTTVMALGGASWSRLGSNGNWTAYFDKSDLAPFQPSNAGLSVTWSSHMTPHFGQPLKGLRLTAGELSTRGEIVISSRGLEGGGLYALTPALREGHPLLVDLKPDVAGEDLAKRTAQMPRKVKTRLARLGLNAAAIALVNECARPLNLEAIAEVVKHLRIPNAVLRPMDEAISTAGGIRFDALNDDLMLKSRPGLFIAGEMLDWEAPTGGYLLNACFATGLWAGQGAVRYLNAHPK